MNPTDVAYGLWNGADTDSICQAIAAGVRTFITSENLGGGDADRALGQALQGRDRAEVCVIGSIQARALTDSTEGTMQDRVNIAINNSLGRIGLNQFDVLLLENPDREGFRSAELWDALAAAKAAGLTASIGIAPGPANGYTLDLLHAFDRFGDRIDWAMVVFGALESWPNELCFAPAKAANIGIIARESRIPPGPSAPRLKEQRSGKIAQLAEIAQPHGIPVEKLRTVWTLSHAGISTVALRLEEGEKASALGETPAGLIGDFAKVVEIGSNRGTTPLKGGTQQFQGQIQAEQWPLDDELNATAEKHGIVPDRDYLCRRDPRDHRDFGMPSQGIPQAVDERLFLQLQVFTGVRDQQLLVDEFAVKRAEAVIYADLNDPFGVGILLWDQDPAQLNRKARELYRGNALTDATMKPEFTMLGRTYAFGREDPVHWWLNRRPIEQSTRADLPWAVWYPLKRKPEFYRLPPQKQGEMLREHGVIGHNYGSPGYATDIRLECFGMDANDNEFVLGLLSERLYWLSRLVKEMRGTQQTGEFMQSIGPFFVGETIYQNGGSVEAATNVGY
ncbi:MAG: aryl-alcohol dehydrogenase-like predicted oxidoreductase [Verrucomicrobiales bacterium]|jgi:aryl-alcohol dehydrogenase-like predicted oxidoreductase